MNYEKKYKEALERVQKEYSMHKANNAIGIMDALERVFSELAESEDEKIRNKIIAVIHLYYGEPLEDEAKDMIAWLEKQGEQKLIDKIQLGKKYRCIASPRYSTFMTGETYKPEDKFLCSLMNFCSDCFEPVEDGEQKPELLTKEKALKNSPFVEQKPAEWIDKDREMIKRILDFLSVSSRCNVNDYEVIEDWLKSLEDRCLPQPKQEWNEEEQVVIDCTVDTLKKYGLPSLAASVKSLRPHKQWKPTKEQMKAIRIAAEVGTANNSWAMNVLKELYEQLKKLTEE